jgi:hypothetical protein
LEGSLRYKHPTLVQRKQGMVCNHFALQSSQEMTNGSCWLLGKGLSLSALRGLVWTVYQFCTMLTKMHEWHLKFLTHCGPDMQSCVFRVIRSRTGHANLRF